MVSAPGALPRQIVIDTAVANAGLEWRPWKGGAAPVRLAQGNGIPSLSDAKAATMARGHLIPGGASLMRAAKLEPLGLGDPVDVPIAATFLANLAGDDSTSDGLAALLHTSQAAGGSAPHPATRTALDARTGLFNAFGPLIDGVSETVLASAAASIASLRAGGLAGDAVGGGALAAAIAAAPPSAEEQLDALRAQIGNPHLNEGAPNY